MTNNGSVVVVSVSIVHGDRVLLIQENKPLVRNKWSFPGGRIEKGESIQAAAVREVKEETGYDVRLTGTVYEFISSLNSHVTLFHFVGEMAGGSLRPAPDEIKDCCWALVQDLTSGDIDYRDAGVMRQISDNLLSGNILPLTVFHPSLC
ncbi:NUDIX hydrolase [Paenibacillus ihbetae]|uniref:DNA mismatch repair protein MutT n=1 Tax=Paenibacillus ihbetae TaxID=1870820 RepID=A0A1B2E5R5_9BACL|nr:NUDIX domain-containing protein [Paenibacillus ihbetae]ANY75315.1 DNA mismatch repair protein MutT [Paenibacillus ihbetae]OOC62517.1 DNA mismatch repair protein MutT [Paenibacillus ihbetae]